LENKKQRLFEQGDESKWELPDHVLKNYFREELLQSKKDTMLLMLPKETTQEMDMRNWFAYQNNLCLNEC
jgi:succinylarginine dihydrolase